MALGVADGATWSVAPSIYMQMFPGKHSATLFSISVAASAVMSVILNFGVEPAVYNAHPVDANGMCAAGIQCFVGTHAVAFGFGVAAVVAAVILTVLTRRHTQA